MQTVTVQSHKQALQALHPPSCTPSRTCEQHHVPWSAARPRFQRDGRMPCAHRAVAMHLDVGLGSSACSADQERARHEEVIGVWRRCRCCSSAVGRSLACRSSQDGGEYPHGVRAVAAGHR